MDELLCIYRQIKKDIEKRIGEFKENGRNEEKMKKEFIFCLLTPQSKAKTCWKAVESLFSERRWDRNFVISRLNGVRFKYKKAEYVIEAVKKFDLVKNTIDKMKDEKMAREWLVKNIKGMGYKEASHFLRNTGKAENLAILDRHILKNMKKYGIINEIPPHMNRKKYMEIEKRFIEFADYLEIPPLHLDFVLWYKETGEVFK